MKLHTFSLSVVIQLLSRVQLFETLEYTRLPCFSQGLLKLMVLESVMPLTPSSSVTPFCCCPQSFPSGSFPKRQLFTAGGRSIRVSSSVCRMNSQGWFPLGLMGLISLLSKELSRVLYSTTIQKHQFFASGGQSIGALALALPMNSQGWFPLGWTALISLLSKRLSGVFISTTVRKH